MSLSLSLSLKCQEKTSRLMQNRIRKCSCPFLPSFWRTWRETLGSCPLNGAAEDNEDEEIDVVIIPSSHWLLLVVIQGSFCLTIFGIFLLEKELFRSGGISFLSPSSPSLGTSLSSRHANRCLFLVRCSSLVFHPIYTATDRFELIEQRRESDALVCIPLDLFVEIIVIGHGCAVARSPVDLVRDPSHSFVGQTTRLKRSDLHHR